MNRFIQRLKSNIATNKNAVGLMEKALARLNDQIADDEEMLASLERPSKGGSDAKLYVRSFDMTFEVVYLAESEDDANAFMENTPDCGVIYDEHNNDLGKIVIAKNEPE